VQEEEVVGASVKYLRERERMTDWESEKGGMGGM
jgi:hypothetical protein